MPRRYFENFPTINYNGYNIRDLTVSAKLINKYSNAPYDYYRYDIDRDERADQVASAYYSDQYMTWMIYYANKVIDPYYDWFLSEDDFSNHLIQKYGSIDVPFKKILEFRNNWYNDDTELSPDDFYARFGEYTKPHSEYWNPNFNYDSGTVISYTRKVSNNVINTNKICKVAVSNNDTSKLVEGDVVDIRSNGAQVGTAEVLAANSTYVFVKNVLGDIQTGYNISLDRDATIFVSISNSSPSYITSNDVWTRVNISEEEYIYWDPYTAFDMERTNNNSKKNIKLVQPALAIKVADKLEAELNGRE